MAIFGLKSRIFRTQGHNSVLWGRSEFTLGPMECLGWFYVVALQTADLETKLVTLVCTRRHYKFPCNG